MRLLFASSALFVACASSPPPEQKAASPAAIAAAPPTASAAMAAPATPEPAPPKKQLPPVQVLNLCHDVAVLAYGEPPNMKSESLGRFVGDGGEGLAPRERDGTLPVTLVDEEAHVLARVTVSRQMKKLEIGRSCRTLYAH